MPGGYDTDYDSDPVMAGAHRSDSRVAGSQDPEAYRQDLPCRHIGPIVNHSRNCGIGNTRHRNWVVTPMVTADTAVFALFAQSWAHMEGTEQCGTQPGMICAR
jgi:hypothetical protein